MPTLDFWHDTFYSVGAGSAMSALSGIGITVYESDGVTPAAVYDHAGTPISQPVLSNAQGYAAFAAEAGYYRLEIADTIGSRIPAQSRGWNSVPGGVAAITRAQLPEAGAVLPPVASIIGYGGSVAPAGWLLCDGSTYQTGSQGSTYYDLSQALNGLYNSPAPPAGQFRVPDLRGRVLLMQDASTTLLTGHNRSLGQKDGTEYHAMTIAEMPRHSHAIPFGSDLDTGSGAWTVQYSSSNPALGNTQIASGHTGGDGAGGDENGTLHNNMQPYQVANYIIKF